MKKLTVLIVAGMMVLGLGDMVQRAFEPQAAPTVTAWVKLKELFH
jgi:hypothetical protein